MPLTYLRLGPTGAVLLMLLVGATVGGVVAVFVRQAEQGALLAELEQRLKRVEGELRDSGPTP